MGPDQPAQMRRLIWIHACRSDPNFAKAAFSRDVTQIMFQLFQLCQGGQCVASSSAPTNLTGIVLCKKVVLILTPIIQ